MSRKLRNNENISFVLKRYTVLSCKITYVKSVNIAWHIEKGRANVMTILHRDTLDEWTMILHVEVLYMCNSCYVLRPDIKNKSSSSGQAQLQIYAHSLLKVDRTVSQASVNRCNLERVSGPWCASTRQIYCGLVYICSLTQRYFST